MPHALKGSVNVEILDKTAQQFENLTFKGKVVAVVCYIVLWALVYHTF